MRSLDTPSSFQHIYVEDIEVVDPCDELTPIFSSGAIPYRAGLETWSCAWAPDNSYFAWSCGSRLVQLLPWDKCNGRLREDSKNCNRNDERNQQVNLINEAVSLIPSPVIEDVSEENANYVQHKTRRKRNVRTIDCGAFVWSVAFGAGTSRDNGQTIWKRFKFDQVLILATGLQNGKIKTWDCNTGNLLMELLDHKDIVREINFAPDNSLFFASASRDGTLKVWDLNDDGNMTKTLRGKASWCYSCKWSPNCKMLAGVGNNKSVTVWNVENTKSFMQLQGHYHEVVSCDFSPDGSLLATASYDTRVIIWDPFTGDSLLELGHLFPEPRPIYAGGANDHYVRGISFCKNGLQLTTVCDDGYMRVWDMEESTNPVAIAQHTNALCCRYSPNGHTIAVGDRDGGVVFYRNPSKVANLQHITRQVIRRLITSPKIDHLHLPLRLKEYLKYHSI